MTMNKDISLALGYTYRITLPDGSVIIGQLVGGDPAQFASLDGTSFTIEDIKQHISIEEVKSII